MQSALFLVGGLGAPLIGWAFDRLGPRRLFQGAALLTVLAFVAAAHVTSLPVLAIVCGVVGGLGLAVLGGQANMIVAALWYPLARGRAITGVDLGTAAGAFVFVRLGEILVTNVGWRATLLVWTALLVGIVLPLNAFQRLPPVAVAGPVTDASSTSWTLREALRSSPFWWLCVNRFFSACAFPLMNVHMVAYAIGQGVTPAQAATALGAVSLVSLAGRLTTGWLCDRLGRAETLTITYSRALGVACLSLVAVTGAPWWLVLYVALYGMAQGSSGIVGSARAVDVFSGPAFGAIFGWLSLATGPGEALAAWAGWADLRRNGELSPRVRIRDGVARCGGGRDVARALDTVCCWAHVRQVESFHAGLERLRSCRA